MGNICTSENITIVAALLTISPSWLGRSSRGAGGGGEGIPSEVSQQVHGYGARGLGGLALCPRGGEGLLWGRRRVGWGSLYWRGVLRRLLRGLK